MFGPSTLGAGAKTRLESRLKKSTPHIVCRPANIPSIPHMYYKAAGWQNYKHWLSRGTASGTASGSASGSAPHPAKKRRHQNSRGSRPLSLRRGEMVDITDIDDVRLNEVECGYVLEYHLHLGDGQRGWLTAQDLRVQRSRMPQDQGTPPPSRSPTP